MIACTSASSTDEVDCREHVIVTADRFRALALALDGVVEVPHMDRAAFRTTRRIFVTLAPGEATANLAFDPELQAVFTLSRPAAFSAIDNGWGRQGWTTVLLDVVDEGSLADALAAAHRRAQAPTARAGKKKAAQKPMPRPKKTTAT